MAVAGAGAGAVTVPGRWGGVAAARRGGCRAKLNRAEVAHCTPSHFSDSISFTISPGIEDISYGKCFIYIGYYYIVIYVVIVHGK